jgi:hypothetical protein
MIEFFILPIKYKGKLNEYEAVFYATGHRHKFHVTLEGIEVTFEPGDQRNYLARLEEETIRKNLAPNAELVRLIAKRLESLI